MTRLTLFINFRILDAMLHILFSVMDLLFFVLQIRRRVQRALDKLCINEAAVLSHSIEYYEQFQMTKWQEHNLFISLQSYHAN